VVLAFITAAFMVPVSRKQKSARTVSDASAVEFS